MSWLVVLAIVIINIFFVNIVFIHSPHATMMMIIIINPSACCVYFSSRVSLSPSALWAGHC